MSASKYPYETATEEQKQVGAWWWCVHHAIHLEQLTEPLANRVDYIKNRKPKDEIERRLRELAPVLHPERIPERLAKAWAEYDKARAEYDKALAEYDKARAEHDKAWAEHAKAWAEHETELMALHKEEYPGTKWNGRSIFSEGK